MRRSIVRRLALAVHRADRDARSDAVVALHGIAHDPPAHPVAETEIEVGKPFELRRPLAMLGLVDASGQGAQAGARRLELFEKRRDVGKRGRFVQRSGARQGGLGREVENSSEPRPGRADRRLAPETFVEQLGERDLGADHVLLKPLADAVLRLGDLRELPQQVDVLHRDVERALRKPELDPGPLDRRRDAPGLVAELRLRGAGRGASRLALASEEPRKRQALSQPELLAGEWRRVQIEIADRHVAELVAKARIGQRPRGIDARLCGLGHRARDVEVRVRRLCVLQAPREWQRVRRHGW